MSRSRAAELLRSLSYGAATGAVVFAVLGVASAEAAAPVPAAPPASAPAQHKAERGARAVRPWDFNWDRAGPAKVRLGAGAVRLRRVASHGAGVADSRPDSQEGARSRTLYLVRHGQYANSESSADDAQHTLTPLGREQAAQTGKRLAALLAGTPVACVSHSTMTRAAETAVLVAAALPGVPLRPCALLREGAPARPEPDTWKPRERDVWADSARIEAAFRQHFRRAEPGEAGVEIIVCHGNVIRFCALRALQLPPEAWLRLGLANGSISKVVMRADGGVSLHCLGDSGHFEPKLISFN
jgi:serine/threonine-protein phosphatase PGAM5